MRGTDEAAMPRDVANANAIITVRKDPLRFRKPLLQKVAHDRSAFLREYSG
jgi:hypothetical protein